MVRFDGFRFAAFNRSNTEGILSDRFAFMFCDARGGFWAVTENLGITHYSQGRFKTYTLHDGLDSNTILSVTGDDSGKLWVLTRGHVNQWDPARARFNPLDRKTYPYRYPVFPSGFFYKDESGVHVFQRGAVAHYALPAGVPPPHRDIHES